MKPRASQVSVSPSGLAIVTTTDVQAALAELDAALDAVTGGLSADVIPFTPTGTIAATNVQDAIVEAASEAGGVGGGGTTVEINYLRMLAYTIVSGSWPSQWTDGSTAYAGYADAGTGTQERVIDLGAEVPITDIVWTLFWGDARIYNGVKVDVSDDGSSWTNVRASGTYDPDSTGLVVTVDGTWRYVRIHSEGSDLFANNEWVEVVVKGTIQVG